MKKAFVIALVGCLFIGVSLTHALKDGAKSPMIMGIKKLETEKESISERHPLQSIPGDQESLQLLKTIDTPTTPPEASKEKVKKIEVIGPKSIQENEALFKILLSIATQMGLKKKEFVGDAKEMYGFFALNAKGQSYTSLTSIPVGSYMILSSEYELTSTAPLKYISLEKDQYGKVETLLPKDKNYSKYREELNNYYTYRVSPSLLKDLENGGDETKDQKEESKKNS